MNNFKDNYVSNVLAQIRPFASVLGVLVSLALLSGLGLVLGSTTDAGQILGSFALVGILAVMFSPRMLANAAGFIGRSKQTSPTNELKHLQAAVKYPTKKAVVYSQVPLNPGQMTPLGGAVPFPFGDGYLTMFLDIFITLTLGTGSGAVTEGELLFIKNIYLKTDKHGPIVDNVCGRALFRRAQKCLSTSPYKDAIAAATATYVVSTPIHFANPRLRRKEDTLLDMADVKAMDLQITLGGVADLLTTVGTSSVTVTADISVEKTLTPVDVGNHPIRQSYLSPINPWDPNIQQNIELPKINDLGILDLMMFTSNSATNGVPWSGTPTANVVKKWTFEDNVRRIFDNISVTNLKNDNKLKFQYETIVTGLFVFDFIEEDSVWQGYSVGGRAKVNINWVNDTLSTSQVSGLIDGTLNLKNLSVAQ